MLSNQTKQRKDLKHMDIITRKIKYTPHDLNHRFHACKTYSNGRFKVREICRLYHCSKASFMRWMSRFDGSKDSLFDHSKRPKSPHPNAHTAQEIDAMKRFHFILPLILC